jgi:endonuclease G, mitochondrial
LNVVGVAKSFYYGIYGPNEPNMIAFLLPNKNSSKPLKEFVFSVEYLESLTAINFLPALHYSIENRLESRVVKKYLDVN